MAYRFNAEESVPHGVRRVASQEIDSAIEELSGTNGKSRDESIHEARKSIKKVRGVLRLVQPELGDAYAAETGRLCGVARKLSEFRDAGAIIETFDELTKKYSGELKEDTLDSVRAGLIKRKEEGEKGGDVDSVLARAASRLRTTGKKVKTWPLETDGFAAIAQGLEDTYRRGRRALARAKEDPRPETYHSWRKRVKEHWYHTRLLENLWTEVMQVHEKCLKDLETMLGTDHNLAVLRDRIAAEPAFYGEEPRIELVLELIERYQKEIRDNSVSLGDRIYHEKPRHFALRMKGLWEAWQEHPEPVESAEPPPKKEPKSAGRTGKESRSAA